MEYDSLLKLVKERRSIRRFKPDPIPDEYVDKIIEVARWAPSGFNMQPWEFVVVKEPYVKERLIEYVDQYWMLAKSMEATREPWQGKPWSTSGVRNAGMDYTTAPVLIILFGDTRTNAGLPMGARYDPNRCRTIFTSSLASAFLYMHLAATTLGLASQWVSAITTPYAACMVKDLLGIPAEMEPYDMAPVANRLTISLTGSTSSIGMASRRSSRNRNRPLRVARSRAWSSTRRV